MKYFIPFKRDIYDGIKFCLLISSILLAGCATPNQSSSFQNDLSMMFARKSMEDYMGVRDKFISYAHSKDAEGLFLMMSSYGYDKQEMSIFFEKEIFPFFSDYSKVITPDIFNIVNDEDGNPGYTMYGFIETTNGSKKPYAIAITEKGKYFAVKNIVVNKCFKGLHSGC